MTVDVMGWTLKTSASDMALLNAKGHKRHNVNSIANAQCLRQGGAGSLHMQAANVDKSRNCTADNPTINNSLAKGHWALDVDCDVSAYVKGRSRGGATKQRQAICVLAAVPMGATVPRYYPPTITTAATLADAKAGDWQVMDKADFVAWVAANRARNT